MALIEDGKIKLEPDDVYDFDILLTDFIIQGISLLKETKTTIPNSLFSSCNDNEEEASKKWNDILDNIINGLSHNDDFSSIKESPYSCYINENNEFISSYKEGIDDDYVKNWEHEKDCYEIYCRDQRLKAFTLLSNHFDDLWY